MGGGISDEDKEKLDTLWENNNEFGRHVRLFPDDIEIANNFSEGRYLSSLHLGCRYDSEGTIQTMAQNTSGAYCYSTHFRQTSVSYIFHFNEAITSSNYDRYLVITKDGVTFNKQPLVTKNELDEKQDKLLCYTEKEGTAGIVLSSQQGDRVVWCAENGIMLHVNGVDVRQTVKLTEKSFFYDEKHIAVIDDCMQSSYIGENTFFPLVARGCSWDRNTPNPFPAILKNPMPKLNIVEGQEIVLKFTEIDENDNPTGKVWYERGKLELTDIDGLKALIFNPYVWEKAVTGEYSGRYKDEGNDFAFVVKIGHSYVGKPLTYPMYTSELYSGSVFQILFTNRQSAEAQGKEVPVVRALVQLFHYDSDVVALSSGIGKAENLETSEKSTLVAAINELVARVNKLEKQLVTVSAEYNDSDKAINFTAGATYDEENKSIILDGGSYDEENKTITL